MPAQRAYPGGGRHTGAPAQSKNRPDPHRQSALPGCQYRTPAVKSNARNPQPCLHVPASSNADTPACPHPASHPPAPARGRPALARAHRCAVCQIACKKVAPSAPSPAADNAAARARRCTCGTPPGIASCWIGAQSCRVLRHTNMKLPGSCVRAQTCAQPQSTFHSTSPCTASRSQQAGFCRVCLAWQPPFKTLTGNYADYTPVWAAPPLEILRCPDPDHCA